MFNNIPQEEVIEFFIVLAQWCLGVAKYCFIAGIIFTILGLAIFGLVVILRSSKEVKSVRRVRKTR